MQLQQRINALAELGKRLTKLAHSESVEASDLFEKAHQQNGWFTPEHLAYACQSWGHALKTDQITKWVSNYDLEKPADQVVGIVMAGNVPLVGLHDFLSVLVSGNRVLVKLSSRDKVLLPYLSEQLIAIEPEFKNRIQFTEGKLEGFDAIIATGSNNTARYFDYYFGSYPNIIRRNRNGIAVLDGSETPEQLDGLVNDMLRYYGMGCRNVSKLWVPMDYSFDPLFNAIYHWKSLIHEQKYMNNYDYNKAVYLMSIFPILDNEFLILKEDEGISSPIAVVYYEFYNSDEELTAKLEKFKDQIQCVVGAKGWPEEVAFGQAQNPRLWDYADGIDTLQFLTSLSK